MVSLSGEQGQGGYFFNRDDSAPGLPSQAQEEALASDTASLGLVPETKFHPMHTTWIAILQLILFIAYETLQFIFPNKNLMNGTSLSLGGTDPPFSFLAILHVGLWAIIFISDRVLQYQHHQCQSRGYLEFFRETKELRRLPYAILSIGNAVLLVLFAVIGHDDKSNRGDLALYNILQITFTIEFVLCVPGILWYLVKVIKFNRRRPLPDAEDSDFLNTYLNNGVSSSMSVTGYRDNDYLDEVLEKQADMIRYLQQHNANLGKRLMKLTQQQSRAA
ncbi:hypothetical protein OS493_022856 [Desmophyllum pertusum]|uniref:Transmembrane protein 192 n=1 Tax=Desmophyllum pertusum TaxID=174260 RepID=A0A9W9ZM41_9CNID|nr:hypothetical protein OS493_022856 [Desmophyllum pertusum]